MFIYLEFFLISILLFYLKNKVNNKFLKKILIFFALLLPCVLAGIRHHSIGTDVDVYVSQLFNKALYSNSWSEYYNSRWWFSWHFIYVSDYEIGFSFLIYLVTKIFSNFQIVLFFIELFIILPIYCSIKNIGNLKDKEYIVFFVFYMLFFNLSLNAMRQFISLSYVFLAFSFLINKRKFKYFFYVFVAFLFHKSSIMALLVFIIYEIINNKSLKNIFIVIGEKKYSFNKLISFFLVFIALFLMLNSNYLVNFIQMIGLDKYSGYISGNVSMSISKFIKVLPIFFLFIVHFKKMKIKYSESSFLFVLLVLKIIISNFSSVNTFGERISYIFDIFLMVTIPYLCTLYNSKKDNVTKILLISYLVFYWWFYYVYGGNSETIPFKTFF